MNLNKKLINIGFKRIKPFKYSFGNIEYPYLYDFKFDPKLGNIKVKKEFSKNNKFYRLEYNNYISIWLISKNDFVVNVFLKKNENVYEIIFNDIKNKLDLIKILPKEIHRDLIINEILK